MVFKLMMSQLCQVIISVAIDTLAAEQIEIVRGPAAVIYGGGATGGVINIIDNRIHSDYYEGLMGAYDLGTGGANNETGGFVFN